MDVFKRLNLFDKAWKKEYIRKKDKKKNKPRKRRRTDPDLLKTRMEKLIPRQAALRRNATEEEIIFKEYLEYYGIRYVFQRGFISGDNFCIADFYLPDFALVVEIDGPYHNTSKQKRRDSDKDNYYKKRHLNVLRIKNEDVEKFPISYFQNLSKTPIKPVINIPNYK